MVKASITLDGPLFEKSAVGKFRRNVYSVAKKEATIARDVSEQTLRAKQQSTSPGPSLASNIVIVPRRRRGGRMQVLVSANYGPEPLVRFYNRFVDTGKRSGTTVRRGHRFYAAGAKAAQTHINSRTGQIERELLQGLN